MTVMVRCKKKKEKKELTHMQRYLHIQYLLTRIKIKNHNLLVPLLVSASAITKAPKLPKKTQRLEKGKNVP